MNISVKAYPAKDGDRLLICFGGDDTYQTYILIDSGYRMLVEELQHILGLE